MEGKPKRRSGTEKRRTPKTIAARVTIAQKAEVVAKADHAGITESALVLQAVLGIKPSRAARRPTANQKLVVQLMHKIVEFKTSIDRVGNNFNQLVKHANAGNPQWNALQLAYSEFKEYAEGALDEIRTAYMEALGREKGRETE